MRILFFLLIFSFPSLSQSDPCKNVYTESAWKERDSWQRPLELVGKLKINQGSSVADIGCHEGYMTFKLSDAVGSKGKVFAVDVDQARLDKLKEHVNAKNIKNIFPIKGDNDDPGLPAASLDAVIILDTFHEMDNHDKILQHVKAALKKGGRLVLCEPIAEGRRNSSRAEQERRHELGMNYALADLEKAGFVILEKRDPFADREKIKGDKMWLIVAVRK